MPHSLTSSASRSLATSIRVQLFQMLPALQLISTIYILFTILRLLTNSRTPLVAVLSGSMEPAFQRGDLLLLSNRTANVGPKVGDIPVVWFEGQRLPMVHRVVKTVPVALAFGEGVEHDLSEEMDRGKKRAGPDWTGGEHWEMMFLTKGDNNIYDDLALYPAGRDLVRRMEVVGNVVAYVPKVGWPALWIVYVKVWVEKRVQELAKKSGARSSSDMMDRLGSGNFIYRRPDGERR